MTNSRTYRLHLVAWILLIASLPMAAAARSAEEYPLLRESVDPALQERLDKLVEKQGLENAVRQGKLAIALVDITEITRPRMAAVNGDRMEYAASLPKIAILLAAFVQIEQGKRERFTGAVGDQHAVDPLPATARFLLSILIERVIHQSCTGGRS